MIKLGDLEFYKEIALDHAMGGATRDVICYSIMRGNHCFCLRYTLGSTHRGTFKDNTGREPPPQFDRKKEAEIFDKIVSTFRFLK